ncbi:MAG: hypothetical protein IT292_08000 [Deltaproteobacteria bacterium]|nr:hypothetical protein [Deltaproteobacteria bacterium]
MPAPIKICPNLVACNTNRDKAADRVFGQANFTSGGCNRDNMQGISKQAANNTLCYLELPRRTNLAEYWTRMHLDVDSVGNLYAIDAHNNRVLKYNKPYGTKTAIGEGDTVADFVWGQSDFSQNNPNQGRSDFSSCPISLFVGTSETTISLLIMFPIAECL